MNKIKSISILVFSIIILLCSTLPGFALAENTLQNNQIAILYLYTKSSFDYHTFSKGDADINGALDEGLLFTEWIKNKDFEPFKFGDEISGTINVDEQIKMANDILNHKYSYKVLEHDFGNDEFGNPINNKMVEYKLPEKVGRSFQVMTEIFLKINNAWNGVKPIDYTGNYMLVNSVNKATQNNPVMLVSNDSGITASIGAIKNSLFTYGDTFEIIGNDGILYRLGYWATDYTVATKDYNYIKKGDNFISEISFKIMKFIDNEWVLDEKITVCEYSYPSLRYPDDDYNSLDFIVEGNPSFDLQKALLYNCSYAFYYNKSRKFVSMVRANNCILNPNNQTIDGNYFIRYYTKRVLYSNDLDEIVNFRQWTSTSTANSVFSVDNVYNPSIETFIDTFSENIVNKNDLNKLNPTFEGSVREQWQTGDADFSKPYVDNFLPSRGWDYWALCGLLIEDFKNGYKNYYYLITFPVESINADGTMNLRNSFSTYEHIKETAPGESILRNEAVGGGKYEDVKDELPNDKNSIDFISYHINNLLALPGLNSIVIFGLTFGLAIFVIGRRGF